MTDEQDVERTDAMPPVGVVPAYDAGWFAHEVGLSRDTVAVFALEPGWALLGYDSRRALVAKALAP